MVVERGYERIVSCPEQKDDCEGQACLAGLAEGERQRWAAYQHYGEQVAAAARAPVGGRTTRKETLFLQTRTPIAVAAAWSSSRGSGRVVAFARH